LPEEAGRAQPFEVDVDLCVDLRRAGRDDDLAATVDYSQICEVTRSVIEGPRAVLLEHLAEEIARRAIAVAGGRAQGVVVAVRKLRPPVPVELSSAGVRIWRRAPDPSEGPQAPGLCGQ
jgi:dihydroneopterin aldolase